MNKKEDSNLLSNFWVGFSLIVIATSIIAISISKVHENWVNTYFWTIQGFFCIISILSHLVSTLGIKSRDEFHTYYLGSMAVRFILSLFFILISLLYVADNKITYVLNFLILYIIYASFEIYHLLRNLRADS